MRKPVKSKASSPMVNPKEGRISSGGAKHSTGSAGRAYPANLNKVVRKRGNPPGAKKS